MCIILDTCTINAVFDPASEAHARFIPVYDWIVNRRGKIVIGGEKYRREIGSRKLTRLLAEFERSGALVKIGDTEVDFLAKKLKDKIPETNFDDEHLIALVSASRCRVVCTDDKRAMPYLKRADLYPPGIKRPKIYQTARNANLCCDDNIAAVCRAPSRAP